MIPVKPASEPPNFSVKVRKPGQQFLAKTPNPTAAEWRNHSYWRRTSRDLREAYGGICAYSATWIPYIDGQSVEHFIPKSRRSDLAYEWNNYRYVFSYLNGCKGVHDDVLDPLAIESGWFAIHFPSLLIVPRKGLPKKTADQVRTTVKRVHLNDEDRCLADRRDYLLEYCLERVTFDFLVRKAPFLAQELKRQKLIKKIRKIMRFEH